VFECLISLDTMILLLLQYRTLDTTMFTNT
jgi:hypothetical protein